MDDTGTLTNEYQLLKQPDWTYERAYSGKWPADRLDDHRAYEQG